MTLPTPHRDLGPDLGPDEVKKPVENPVENHAGDLGPHRAGTRSFSDLVHLVPPLWGTRSLNPVPRTTPKSTCAGRGRGRGQKHRDEVTSSAHPWRQHE